MVWGGICYNARTALVVFDRGSVNAHKYVTEVLEPDVIPFTPFIGDNCVIMHDNAYAYIAKIDTDYLDAVNIQ